MDQAFHLDDIYIKYLISNNNQCISYTDLSLAEVKVGFMINRILFHLDFVAEIRLRVLSPSRLATGGFFKRK